jgi:iron complex outermembrane receptor protein
MAFRMLCLAFLLGSATALRAQDEKPPQDVTDIDLDDLLKVQVTTAGRKSQPLSEVPAAITVIRGDDVRRTGATSIAESLRAAPGYFVGRTTANSWAICPRGFGDVLSNKLLVLIDGRTVYSPLHSGVHWDVQDVFLDDLDRIEAIRGPGGTLWGANAVNGVVNVITKSAEESQGWLTTAGGGSEARVFGGARYGFKAADDLYVRVYAKYFQWDDAREGTEPDRRAHDGWFLGHGGFRADWKASDRDRLTFMADYSEGQVMEDPINPTLTAPFAQVLRNRVDVRSADAVFRWDRTFSPESGLSLQLSYDYTMRDAAQFRDVLQTGDIDFQHRFRPFAGDEIIWGAGYRIYRSVVDGSLAFTVDPRGHTDDVISAFLQNELAVVPKHLTLTVGSKIEHNDYSGLEYQPSARLAWTPEENHMAWAAVTRAVRTPSILDADGELTPITAAGPVAFTIFGNHEFKSEHLLAYEAGYRVRPADFLMLDLAAFYNRYDRLRTGTVGTFFVDPTPPPAHLVIPINLANDMRGQTRGMEFSANVQAVAGWLIQANYAYFHMNMNQGDINRRSPHHQAWIRSAVDFSDHLSADVTARYVSKLPPFDIKAYVEVDVRLAWRDFENRLEIALVGQNLAHTTHPEFGDAVQRSEMQRAAFASVTWRF